MASRKKANEGDQQLQAVGDGIILFFKALKNGVYSLKENLWNLAVFIVVIMICGVVFYLREIISEYFVNDQAFHIMRILPTLSIFVPILVLFLIGCEKQEPEDDFAKKFAEIKFCGKGGNYPKFLSKILEGKKVIYSFHTPGLNIQEWRNKQKELETVLDCNIVKIQTAKTTKQVIKLHTIPTSEALSTNLLWENNFITDKDFVLTAGQGMLDEVTFDLNKYPHALIAGVTGSGKSVILRCMLWQCISKGAKIYMIDFKGGVEFGQQYEQFGEVITDRQNALELTKELVEEMKLRLAVFRKEGVKNLTEYNEKYPEKKLCRIVLVCDEIAEMLDKTGLNGSDKAIFYEIEKELSTLARLARAPGINMLLATQRPDAKVIVGQIKNNLPIRISGRMVDPQASEMVLGNTLASTLGDTLGRFMYTIGSDTYEFQAYNFNDTFLRQGSYQIGGMLIESDFAMKEIPNNQESIDVENNCEFEYDDNDDYEGF